MSDHAEKATRFADTAEKLLAGIKLEKSLGRSMDVKDSQIASVAGAFASLALFHQREADREAGR